MRTADVSIPMLDETEEAGNQIAWVEATLFHQQQGYFPARSADYGDDVRSRLEMGTKVSAVDFLQALEIQKTVRSTIASCARRGGRRCHRCSHHTD